MSAAITSLFLNTFFTLSNVNVGLCCKTLSRWFRAVLATLQRLDSQ
jgi:hypothetical protein